MTFLYALGGILIAVALYAISVYNRLIQLKIKVEEGASDIEVQLKRRHDLIPNLIEVVKGASKFEQDTLNQVIQARNGAIAAPAGLNNDKIQAENQLTGALRQLFALAEAYPDLKSNANYLELQRELTNTEDRIVAARRFYNTVVSDYNAFQQQFPAMLFKGLAGAKPAQFFELSDPKEAEVPVVSFE